MIHVSHSYGAHSRPQNPSPCRADAHRVIPPWQAPFSSPRLHRLPRLDKPRRKNPSPSRRSRSSPLDSLKQRTTYRRRSR